MAEYEERSLEDLTEEPSQHKLEELRSKGVIAQSRELTGIIALIGVFVTLYFMTGNFFSEITGLMKDIFTKDLIASMDGSDWSAFTSIGMRCLKILLLSFLPVSGAGLTLGVLASISQVGFNFSTEPLNPDFKRVDPISGFQKLFSFKSLTEAFKAILKFAVVASGIYLAIKAQLKILPSLVALNIEQLLPYIGTILAKACGITAFLLFILGVFDYWVQWRQYIMQARMTKAEVKQELKEREGDPQVKARIRTIQRDIARKRMVQAVPKADVIITNPTHIAVAIVYDSENGVAPKVIAKGADFLAEKIKEIARLHEIPTVENKPLARSLYKHVKVGQLIPRSLYQAVAEILAYVYKLRGRKL